MQLEFASHSLNISKIDCFANANANQLTQQRHRLDAAANISCPSSRRVVQLKFFPSFVFFTLERCARNHAYSELDTYFL